MPVIGDMQRMGGRMRGHAAPPAEVVICPLATQSAISVPEEEADGATDTRCSWPARNCLSILHLSLAPPPECRVRAASCQRKCMSVRANMKAVVIET